MQVAHENEDYMLDGNELDRIVEKHQPDLFPEIEAIRRKVL